MIAMDKNRVIGVDNRLPWHLPADLKKFKQVTLGHAVIMGRKTYESIGKPLPGRTNVIVTRQKEYKAPESCIVVHSLEDAIKACSSDSEPFLIGGADLIVQGMRFVERLYITEIDTAVPRGDVYFPKLEEGMWKLTAREDHSPDEKNPYRYSFLTYERCAMN
jgi:dihydrofolate reductase